MLRLLHSKAGVVIMSLLVCGVFFLLSRLKQRAAAREGTAVELVSDMADAADDDPTESGGQREPSVDILHRAQEVARGRGEQARAERQRGRTTVETFDEHGDTLRRRRTPKPIEAHDLRSGREDSPGHGAPHPVLAPQLRLGPSPARQSQVVPSAGPTAGSGRRAGTSLPVAGPPPLAPPRRFVPFGRLIKAELVVTLESTQEQMPLIGLVVEPVYNNGRLVIPAGAELHSLARADRVRNRIVSINQWKLVFPREGGRPNGRQLTFEGVALDREDRDGSSLTWGLSDGSFGLRGRVMRASQTADELLLFASEALKAASASLMDRQTTLTGTQVESSAKNASLAGGQAVLNTFSQRIARELAENGVYIQVPAGKQFYVYPQQIIDPDRAAVPERVAGVE